MDQSPMLYALKAAKKNEPKPPEKNVADSNYDQMSHKDWQSAVKHLTQRLDALEKAYGQNRGASKPDSSYEPGKNQWQ